MAASPQAAAPAAIELAHCAEMPACRVRIWTASPGEVAEAQWTRLALLLDDAERLRSGQFRVQADRRSYVLAHALRRAALAQTLAVAPHEIAISHDRRGKPVLAAPQGQREIFFSHSRSRNAVTCAVSELGPIGVDIESVDASIADFDLLARYVALPDASRREAELGGDASRQFFFYWTALEAFWKAAGTGLAAGNPRIRIQRADFRPGTFDVALEADGESTPIARVVRVDSPADCVAALACLGITDEEADGQPRS